MNERRLFVGVPVSTTTAKQLARIQREWESLPLSMVPPDNMHITLAFLGFVPEARLFEVCARLTDAVKGIESFEASFGTIAAQPDGDLSEAKTVQCSGEINERLLDLHNRVGRALDLFGVDRRTFRPHITLAWMKRSLWKKLDMYPTFERVVSFLEPIERVALYESIVENGVRKYVVIDEYELDERE